MITKNFLKKYRNKYAIKRFESKNSLALKASLLLYKDETFTEPYFRTPVFTCLGGGQCKDEIYLGISLENLDTDVKLTLVHLWATPSLITNLMASIGMITQKVFL